MTTKMTLDNHATKLVNSVASLFDVNHVNNKLSDVQILVGQKTYYCHKLVLQLNSKYFTDISFQPGVIAFHKIDHEQFYNVLQFMYTGDVLVSKDNIESLLAAADILGMDDLRNVCFRFLNDNFDINTAMLYWRLANRYTQSEFARKCQETVVAEIKKLSMSSGLINVSEEMMKAILSADNLEVKNEMEVCEILMKWLLVQTEAGIKVHPAELLPLIRWSAISVNYVQLTLLQSSILTSDSSSIAFLTKVLTYMRTGIQFEGLQTFHRTPTGLENFLMAIAIDDRGTRDNKMYQISLQGADKVTALAAFQNKKTWVFSAGVVNNNLYAFGHKGLWTWNLVSGWIRCVNMIQGRKFYGAVVLDSIVYILGGRTKETVLNSVEGYDAKTNKWFSAGNLNQATFSPACVCYNNLIYVFGGRDEQKTATNQIQVYNPAQESCTLMKQPMPERPDTCSGIQAVIWETSVILLGPWTCSIYNFHTDTWQNRNQFKTNVHDFAIALDNSTVYIAGGDTWNKDKGGEMLCTDTDEMKCVSVLDIVSDKPAVWRHHAKLPEPGRIRAFATMSLPSNR